MKRSVVLIDGGHLRSMAYKGEFDYSPQLISAVAHRCRAEDEELLRILYYDCAPYTGKVKQPVSGEPRVFVADTAWIHELARMDLFAVRLGILKFRGFRPKVIPVADRPLTDDDFKPHFEQKGVDMRIGLDIAVYSQTRSVDRIILLTADTDCIPAMKHGRKAGLQIALVQLPGIRLAAEMLEHCDYLRTAGWPAEARKRESKTE